MIDVTKLIKMTTFFFLAATSILGHANSALDIKSETNKLANKAPGLKQNILTSALQAYQHAVEKGTVHKHLLTVIDYSLPSSNKRMWVFDLNQHKLLYHTFVAHGSNSGYLTPKHFSNKQKSHESSLGTFITKNSYIGSKGYSLNLQGLEKGFNDNAFIRRVVIHGAWYVNQNFIKSAGRAGRSWGCPAVSTQLARPIINAIKGGSVLFAYYPDKNYLSHSEYVAA